MKVLMVGVDKRTKGGMWTVAEYYLKNVDFCKATGLKYIPTSITGNKLKRIIFTMVSLIKIIFELSVGNYNIVHIHMAERGSVYRKSIVVNLARLFRCKIILHMHGAEFEKWYNDLPVFWQKYVKKMLQSADRIIILGKYWKEFVDSLVEGKTQVQIVYNAVNIPESNHYNLDAHNILFLGAVIKRKGIKELIQGIKMIDKKLDPDVKLWIYGPDVDKSIQDTINKMGLEKRVLYNGYLKEGEKEEVFRQVALNILPSWNEGLPMTILETMAEGIPNISTNVAAIPEAVDEQNGILITPGNIEELSQSILFLMQNEKIRENKSFFAYKKAKEKFSIANHLSQILQIYTEVEKEK